MNSFSQHIRCKRRRYFPGVAMLPVKVMVALLPLNVAGAGLPDTARSVVYVTGGVWHDRNGNLSKESDEHGFHIQGRLYVNLISNDHRVVAAAAVGEDGRYRLPAPANINGYRMVLATDRDALHPCLPETGWVNTGEYTDGANAADQMYSPVGEIALNTGSRDIGGQDFGIEVRPEVYSAGCHTAGGWQMPLPGGRDWEDSLDGREGYTIRILTVPEEGVLYYNTKSLVAGSTIFNYRPELLQFEGAARRILDFTFASVDFAGQESRPCTAILKPEGMDDTMPPKDGSGGGCIDMLTDPVYDHVHFSGGDGCHTIRFADACGSTWSPSVWMALPFYRDTRHYCICFMPAR